MTPPEYVADAETVADAGAFICMFLSDPSGPAVSSLPC